MLMSDVVGGPLQLAHANALHDVQQGHRVCDCSQARQAGTLLANAGSQLLPGRQTRGLVLQLAQQL